MSQEVAQKLALLMTLGGDAEIQALDLVLSERIRQIQLEGFTPERDDEVRKGGQLSAAGACYALAVHQRAMALATTGVASVKPQAAHPCWPFHPLGWKPASMRRNSVKGAALLLADLARIIRGNFE